MKTVSFFCVQSRTILLYLQFLNQKIYSNDITVKSSLAILVVLITLFIFVNVPPRKHGMADDSFSCCTSYSTLHLGYLIYAFFGISNSLLNYCVSKGRNGRFSFQHPMQDHSFSVCPISFKLTFFQLENLFSTSPIVTRCIMNQFLWYMYIKIDNDVAIFKKLPGKGINFLIELFGENGVIKKLCLLKDKFNIESNMHF